MPTRTRSEPVHAAPERGHAVRRDRIDFIDSLRGVAIIGVVAVHTRAEIDGFTGPLSSIAAFGSRGVVLFFMLSAITLATIYSGRGFGAREFFTRRFFRIAPMFYLGAVAYLLINGTEPQPQLFLPNGIGWKQILLTLTFLHVWVIDSFSSVVPGGWSIGCEAMFYLAFPLLLRYVTSTRVALGAFVASFAAAVIWNFGVKALNAGAYDTFQLTSYVAFSAPLNFPAFVSGFLLFFLIQRAELGIFRRNSVAANALLILSSALLIAAGASGYLAMRHPLTACLLLIPFVYAVYLTKPHVLLNPLLEHIGMVSFSVYIVHFAVLHYISPSVLALVPNLGPDLKFVVLWAVALAISVAISTVTYRLVELPFIELAKRLSRRQSAPGAQGP
jgi:exopolysaccharide production protein ExoZ